MRAAAWATTSCATSSAAPRWCTSSTSPRWSPVATRSSDLAVIEAELERYGGLEDRPRLVALNKVDVPDGRDMADLVRDEIAARGWPVFAVSAASHEGLRELTFAMAEVVGGPPSRRAEGRGHAHRDPAAGQGGGAEFTIKRDPGRRLARARREARALGPARPTSATTRRWASSPTGSTGSVSRRSCWPWAPSRGTRC